MIDSIACIFVRLLNLIFSLVPVSACLWLGRRIGTVAFWVNRRRRTVAYANLKAAFAQEKSPQELRAITKRTYQNLVQTFMEVLNLTKVNKRYTDKYVKVVNLERFHEAAKSGRGTILLTAHFGDWELSSLTSAMHGIPISVLVREQKMERLNELLNRLRESKGCKVIRKGMSTKNLIRALYDKNMVGILSDQDAGRNGEFVNFFGRPTSTHIGAMEIAKRTDSLIIPNFIVRVHGPYHRLYLEDYIDFRKTNGENDLKENLQKYADLLETYVRKYPDQWLWMHKRWKSTPVRTVLVLDDGKAGHLNQSLAVARQIQKARLTQNYIESDTRIVVKSFKYKSKFSRALLSFCSNFAGWRSQGSMRCMRFCLEKESYDSLMKQYADFIVSCGSAAAPVNIYMAKENNARNITIMKPDTFLKRNKFDLVIMPKHDNPPKKKNILATTLAPNLINRSAGIKGGNVLGLLLGGDNPEFILSKETAGRIVDAALDFCRTTGAQLVVTTSRRTNAEAESVVKNKLKNNPQCKLLVIANENNPEGTVAGILDMSKIVVVSGESVSMISEAVASGKKTVVVTLDKKTGAHTKHERIVESLAKENYITISLPENLSQTLKKASQDGSPVRKIDDNEKIYEWMRRLI